jgi:hypothetical protein
LFNVEKYQLASFFRFLAPKVEETKLILYEGHGLSIRNKKTICPQECIPKIAKK